MGTQSSQLDSKQRTIDAVFGLNGQAGLQADAWLPVVGKCGTRGLLWVCESPAPKTYVVELAGSEPLEFREYGSLDQVLADDWSVIQ